MNAEPFRPLSQKPLGPEWTKIAHTESLGSAGHLGVAIFVLGAPADMTADEAWAIQKFAQPAHELVCTLVDRRRPEREAETRTNAEQILGCFDKPIYVERLPNGYCSRSCCEHLPWFQVTTRIGRIKIGWRKRVISIDYQETVVQAQAVTLFPERRMTMDGRSLHASDPEDARVVIARIMAAGDVVPA